jgi:hypothetical protein
VPYIQPNGSGLIRWKNGNFEVDTGTGWEVMSPSQISVTVDPIVDTVVDWALERMTEESELKNLINQETPSTVSSKHKNNEKVAQQVELVNKAVELMQQALKAVDQANTILAHERRKLEVITNLSVDHDAT